MNTHVQEVFPPTLEQVLTRLNHVQKSLKGWTAHCPLHADPNTYVSTGLGKDGQVVLHCAAGCSFEAIVEALGLQPADLLPVDPVASPHQKGATQQSISLWRLSQKKRIPWKFLCNLGISEEARGIRIPYYTPQGAQAPRYRIRTALEAGEGSWWNKEAGDIVPYGLERLETARQAGFQIVVEGESDCWTLWYQGFPALGLPGTDMVQTLKVE